MRSESEEKIYKDLWSNTNQEPSDQQGFPLFIN